MPMGAASKGITMQTWLEGPLEKLKSSPSLFGAWNKRWFAVETRMSATGPELVLAYYDSIGDAESIDRAKMVLPLRDLSYVGPVQDPDTHEVTLSERGQRVSQMNPAIAKILLKHSEFMFEVDSPGRHLFLRAGYKGALDRWIAGIQILASLPTTVPWPEEFGRAPRIPRFAIRGSTPMASAAAKKASVLSTSATDNRSDDGGMLSPSGARHATESEDLEVEDLAEDMAPPSRRLAMTAGRPPTSLSVLERQSRAEESAALPPKVAKPARDLPGVDLLKEAEELAAKEAEEENRKKHASSLLQNKIEQAIARSSRANSSSSLDRSIGPISASNTPRVAPSSATDRKTVDDYSDDSSDDDALKLSLTGKPPIPNRGVGSAGIRSTQLAPQSSLKHKDSGARFGWLDAIPNDEGKSESESVHTPTMAADRAPVTPSRRLMRDSAREIVIQDQDSPEGHRPPPESAAPTGAVIRRKKKPVASSNDEISDVLPAPRDPAPEPPISLDPAPPAGSAVRRKPKTPAVEAAPPEPTPVPNSTPGDAVPGRPRVRKQKTATDASALLHPMENLSVSEPAGSTATPEDVAPPVRRVRKKKPVSADGDAPSGSPADVPPPPPEPAAVPEGMVRTKSRRKVVASAEGSEPPSADVSIASVASKPVRRKKTTTSAGVDVDPGFAEANWDDDATDSKLNDSRATTSNGIRRGDPGVAADPNFAEENWDEADAPAPAPAKRLVKKKKAPSGAASDTKMTES